MSLTASILLLTPMTLQGWLAVILFRRHIHRSFPFFFAYTLFSILAGITMLLVQGNVWTYGFVYWVSEALYAVLGFLAIYEAFHWVFRRFYLMWWWFKFLLPAVGVVMMGVSIIEGTFYPPVQAPPVLATIFVAEMAVRCLQGGIFCLFILLVWFLSMPWQNYAFGIALGFAVSGLGIFVTFLVRSKSGTTFVSVIQFVPPVGYIVAVLIWLASFVKPEPPDPFAGLVSPLRPEQVITLLERLTRQVKDVFKRCFMTSSY
jgi:hypothetical protein